MTEWSLWNKSPLHVSYSHMISRFFLPIAALWTAACLTVSAQNAGLDLSALDAAPKKSVAVSIVSEVKTAAAGQAFRLAVKLEHQPHFHTYGKVLKEGIIGKPTAVTWTLPDGWTSEELPWPDTKDVPSTGGEMSNGYDGTVFLPVKIIPPASALAGSKVEIKAAVSGLVCDPKSCRPFSEEAAVTISVGDKVEIDAGSAQAFPTVQTTTASGGGASSAAAAPTVEKMGMALLIGYALIGGLILNVMPCVFPVLGIKVMGLVRQAGEDRSVVIKHGLAYTLGVLVCFWALAALVIVLGKSWGSQLQNASFVMGLTVFFLIFGLSMAGLFEIGTSAVGVGTELQNKSGLSGSFFSGLLAVIVATPCSAPFLGTALGYAVTLPTIPALVLFTCIGLGLALPFLVPAAFPSLVSKLPRPGAWMESFKQGMSFFLIGTVVYLAWVLSGMVSESGFLYILFALVLVAMACWIYGRWCLPHKTPRTRIIALVIALGLAAGATTWAWPHQERLKWEKWSPELVASLRAENKPVYIDFTAKWCATCQVNKRVYHDETLIKLIEEKKIVLLKADWTNPDDRIQKAIGDLGKAAVPVNVLYLPEAKDPIVLPELLSVENVSAELSKAPAP